MTNRLLLYVLPVVFVGILALFFLHYVGNMGALTHALFGRRAILTNTVRGIDVQHRELPYTLNYSQQLSAIDYVNQSVAYRGTAPQKTPLDVQKIAIYRFKDVPTIEIEPLDYDQEGNLLFKAPVLSSGVLKDTSRGGFKKLLSETYDP